MKFFSPVVVTDATLLSSTIPETETGLAVYNAATTYALGDQCFMTTGVHKIYESLQAGNVGNDPTTSPTFWVEVSPTNRWKMFDSAVGTSSVYSDDVVVKIDLPGANYVNSVAFMDVYGVDLITIELLDPADDSVLWSSVHTLQYFGEGIVPDWYWYFFSPAELTDTLVLTNLPYNYGARLQVTFQKSSGATACGIGTFAFGTALDAGDTEWGAKIGIMDFSKKETDELGVTTLLPRVFTKTMDLTAFIPHAQVPTMFRALSAARAKPVIWVGSDESLFSSTIIYGFFRSFDIVMEAANGSYINIEIEGLA